MTCRIAGAASPPHEHVGALPEPMKALAEAAEHGARNLWLSDDLEALSDEQWQRLLVNVETRIRLRGTELPDGWQAALTKYVGRGDV